MLKLIVAARRRQDFTRQQFIDYHKHRHTKVFMQEAAFVRYMKGYTQNHALADEEAALLPHTYQLDATRDVVVEVWYDDTASMGLAFAHPSNISVVQPDERSFVAVDDPETAFLCSVEVSIQKSTHPTEALKLFEFISARRDADAAAFRGQWMESMYRLASTRRDLTSGLVCNLTIPTGSTPPWPAPKYDAVVETWFEGAEQLHDFCLYRQRDAGRLESSIDTSLSRSVITQETATPRPPRSQ